MLTPASVIAATPVTAPLPMSVATDLGSHHGSPSLILAIEGLCFLLYSFFSLFVMVSQWAGIGTLLPARNRGRSLRRSTCTAPDCAANCEAALASAASIPADSSDPPNGAVR